MRILPVIALVVIAAGAWNHFSTRAVAHGPGVLAPDDPVQINRSNLAAFSAGDYQLTPAAEFSLQARVLSTTRYRTGREADLSPIDLALGWGPMSDSEVIDQLQITQGNRFYFYRWQNEPPIPPRDIVEHSANMHMIPASDEVRRQLQKVRVGQIVSISGYLVRIQAPDGWHWNSSMTRTDSGNGACELVWVEEITAQ